MDCIRKDVTNPGDRTKRIGACSQVRLGAKVLKRVSLFRDGVELGIINVPHQIHRRGLNFDSLPTAL